MRATGTQHRRGRSGPGVVTLATLIGALAVGAVALCSGWIGGGSIHVGTGPAGGAPGPATSGGETSGREASVPAGLRAEEEGPGPGVRAVGIPASPAAAFALTAQRVPPNPRYRDRFVFTRIRYDGRYGGFGRGGSAWSHDYPLGDRHLSRILHELTTARVELGGTNVLEIGDPELFRYPVAYISEPGFWTMTDEQAAVLREYVLKGGFLIFDDFEREQLDNTFAQLRRALPAARLIRIEVDHPIFQSFYAMDDIYFPHPLVPVMPVYYGVFEDNDPDRRMLAIVNHNNDIAEYWEWSDRDYLPIDFTNDAYQLGVNYMIFAMTQ